MNKESFDHTKFYSSYSSKVIARPGYPTRAAYKSSLIFSMYGNIVLEDLDIIKTYADIGGCFGFGANSMYYHIEKQQSVAPEAYVFELSPGFVNIGKLLFPKIKFFEEKFEQWDGDVKCFDLVSVFDVIEHILDPGEFLRELSKRSKYILIKTPLETSGDWAGGKPPLNQGENHDDGHINFFTPKVYEKLLQDSNLDIIASCLIPTIVPRGANQILCPEWPVPTGIFYRIKLLRHPKSFLKQLLRDIPGIPWSLKRKVLGGGEHICICRSKSV